MYTYLLSCGRNLSCNAVKCNRSCVASNYILYCLANNRANCICNAY
ncbi:hypothetical protein EUBVEN_02224 [Eubacterium ventriosum ATCC 27560]|uniref:Uncharacterized protein n=1 Tax=Eubacterium ventriosum ATCC 27560 TaxID=411463 RepID=A5Z931_9FIRM|nr:hypothetical protein EUBVEN_02224 [Eubacterium ventriosum ATCC 27560]